MNPDYRANPMVKPSFLPYPQPSKDDHFRGVRKKDGVAEPESRVIAEHLVKPSASGKRAFLQSRNVAQISP